MQCAFQSSSGSPEIISIAQWRGTKQMTIASNTSCMPNAGVAPEVAAIRTEIRRFLDRLDSAGRKIGNAKYGAYAFYDYDGEPIYVGQTEERLRSRIARHLTNQRTDAVAMNVLDPFEVAEIQVWPLYAEDIKKRDIERILNATEYTVFQKVIAESKLGANLNEKPPRPTQL